MILLLMNRSGISVFKAIANYQGLELMIQAHPMQDTFVSEAMEYGIDLQFEAFIDRLYLDDGRLAPRALTGAVLNESAAIKQARQIIETGSVSTHFGQALTINASTLCIHGDNPNALAVAKAVRALLPAKQLQSPAAN